MDNVGMANALKKYIFIEYELKFYFKRLIALFKTHFIFFHFEKIFQWAQCDSYSTGEQDCWSRKSQT